MKRLFATVSVFALLWAAVLPALADEHSASNNCDVLSRVLISQRIIGAERAKLLGTGTSGKLSDTLALLPKERSRQFSATRADELPRVTTVTPLVFLFAAQSTSLLEPLSNPAEAISAALNATMFVL